MQLEAAKILARRRIRLFLEGLEALRSAGRGLTGFLDIESSCLAWG
jgi:hypothetical protein